MEVQRRLLMLNQRVKTLENENSVLRQRLKDIAVGQEDVESYMKRNNIIDILEVNFETSKNNSESESTSTVVNGTTNLVNFSSTSSGTLALNNGSSHTVVPPVPPRPAANSNGQLNTEQQQPAVGKRLEGLLMDDDDGDLDDDFDPRAYEQSVANEPKTPTNQSTTALVTPPSSSSSAGSGLTPPILAPPPKAGRDANRRNYTTTSARAGVEDVFGSTINAATPRPKPQDPFGMGNFSIASSNGGNFNSSSDFQSAIGILDKKIMEMKDGFSRGLSISTEDFSLESLDPLKK